MMDAEEFKDWRQRLGISERSAAAALNISPETVRGYADWSLVIPDEIEERCAYLLAHDAPPTGPLRDRTDAFRAELLAWFPGFATAFEDAMRFGIGRMFTPHGLLSEFSTYYLKQVAAYDTPQMAAFFARLEIIFAADPKDRDGLPNAIATCFLENISATPAGEAGLPLMGPACRRFFIGWHDPSRR